MSDSDFTTPTVVRYNKNGTVIYLTVNEGQPTAVLGLPDMSVDEMDQCILLGPPDLSVLMLNDKQRVELSTALIQAGFLMAPDLMGRRKELQELVKRIGLPVGVVRHLIFVYQKEFYNE